MPHPSTEHDAQDSTYSVLRQHMCVRDVVSCWTTNQAVSSLSTFHKQQRTNLDNCYVFFCLDNLIYFGKNTSFKYPGYII